MRLIDADKLEADVEYWENHDDPKKPDYDTRDIEQVIGFQPIVKAIPIEWLHSIMKKQLIFAMNSEMEGSVTVQDGVIHCFSGAVACQVLANVIELWEKENGTDRQR